MVLWAERDATHQVPLAEALNDLFEKHGLKRVADEQQRLRGGAASRARRGGNRSADPAT
ncbi:ribbon-helix-helix domain-containing protein [Methylobacterium sp. J-092]|uniref:ribbon-helix-helix domain-containing protein n=1 Tax=Methylobacterium sp. J-092 TaxID=2836667 RepID=UPI00391A4330